MRGHWQPTNLALLPQWHNDDTPEYLTYGASMADLDSMI